MIQSSAVFSRRHGIRRHLAEFEKSKKVIYLWGDAQYRDILDPGVYKLEYCFRVRLEGILRSRAYRNLWKRETCHGVLAESP